MSLLNTQASYFSLDNPLRWLERCCYRFRLRTRVSINRRQVEVRWTRRADAAMRRADKPLVVELQLYFSCVVKKRVLFHHGTADFDTLRVNDRLEIAFRPIASAACDPVEFAANFPGDRALAAGHAARMVPRAVEIDYRRGSWEGQFLY